MILRKETYCNKKRECHRISRCCGLMKITENRNSKLRKWQRLTEKQNGNSNNKVKYSKSILALNRKKRRNIIENTKRDNSEKSELN